MTYPPVPDSFYWTTAPWGAALRCRPLDELATHLFTTRQLQMVSQSDYGQLAHAVGVEQLLTLNQVHGAAAVVVRRGSSPPTVRPEADILVSDDPDVAIAVRAADCVPILMADRATGAVAAVHAGWRGALTGVLAATVKAMTNLGAEANRIVAGIGPCIAQRSYEVGPEFPAPFLAADPANERFFAAAAATGKFHFDLRGFANAELTRSGVTRVFELPHEPVEPGVPIHALPGAQVAAQRVADDTETARQVAQQIARPLPAPLERLHDHDRMPASLVEHHHPRGFAPRTPLRALSRAASPARSVRVARSLRSLAP